MNRKIFASAVSLLLLGGTTAFGQMEKTEEKKVTTSSVTTKTKDHVVVGIVKEYQAGEKIKVLVGKKTRSFDLDEKSVSTAVDPKVAVGSRVKVVESKDANGKKTLTVNRTS
jgi:hypothetical protein